jgi:hypothetical protein
MGSHWWHARGSRGDDPHRTQLAVQSVLCRAGLWRLCGHLPGVAVLLRAESVTWLSGSPWSRILACSGRGQW